MKKTLSCILCATVIASSFAGLVGCGEQVFGPGTDSDNPALDTSKTQLYVGYFDGGLGREWLEQARTLFEAQYAEVSFEEGKKGVQIMHDYGKDAYLDGLIEDMPKNRQEVYIMDGVKYYKFIQRDHMLDISDIVTEGGENSLENKMNPALRDYFKMDGGKYYALPFYESYVHMIYDVDLFDKEHLWFAPDGGFVEVDNASITPGARRAGLTGGVDGWDAGLPETYSEFFILLEEMTARGIIPFTWSGAQIATYLPHLTASFWADYQGAEEFAENFTLSGEVPVRTIVDTNFTENKVGEFSLPSEVYSTTMMNKNNAQEVAAMEAGKYYALKLTHDIMYSKKYVNQSRVNSPAESHLLAQATYLQSTRQSKKIAMLVEGGWWYNEADAVMQAMERYGSQYSSMGRRFGVMPIPKADDGSSADGRVYVAPADPSAIFISNYISKTKVNLAKEYVKFINTEEVMRIFTVESNVKRPFEYTLTAEDEAKLSYYAKNVFEASKDIQVEYIVPRSTEMRVHNDFFASGEWQFASRFNVGYGANVMDFAVPFVTYFDYPALDALTWFKGLKTYSNAKPYNFNI